MVKCCFSGLMTREERSDEHRDRRTIDHSDRKRSNDLSYPQILSRSISMMIGELLNALS
jgi:hypothetical protein